MSAPHALHTALDNAVTRHEYHSMDIDREHLQRCMQWLQCTFNEILIVNANSVAYARLESVIRGDGVGPTSRDSERAFVAHLVDVNKRASVCVVLQPRHLLEFLSRFHAEFMSGLMARNFHAEDTGHWLNGVSRAMRVCVSTPPLVSSDQMPEAASEYRLCPFYHLPSPAVSAKVSRQTLPSAAVRLLAARMYATSMALGIRDLSPVYLEGIKEVFCQIACGGDATDLPPRDVPGHKTLSLFSAAAGPLFEMVKSRAESVRYVFTMNESTEYTEFMAQCVTTHRRAEKEKNLAGVPLGECVTAALYAENVLGVAADMENKSTARLVTAVLQGYIMTPSHLFNLLTRDLRFYSIRLLGAFFKEHGNQPTVTMFFYHRAATVPVIRRAMEALCARTASSPPRPRSYLVLQTRDRADDLPVTAVVCTEPVAPRRNGVGVALVTEIDPFYLPGSVMVQPPNIEFIPVTRTEWMDVQDETRTRPSFEFGMPRIPVQAPRPSSTVTAATVKSPTPSIRGVPMWDDIDGGTKAQPATYVPPPPPSPSPSPTATPPVLSPPMFTRYVPLDVLLPRLVPTSTPF